MAQDLRNQELEAVSAEDKRLEPYKQELVDFGFNPDELAKNDPDEIPVSRGNSPQHFGGGIQGMAMSLASKSGAFASRNKGKIGATVGAGGLVLSLGLFGAQTALISFKNNANEYYGGIANNVLNSRQARLVQGVMRSIGNNTAEAIRVSNGTKQVAQGLIDEGYEVLDDGRRLKLPGDGGILEGRAMQREIRQAAKKYTGENARIRSRIAKNFRGKATIQTRAPTQDKTPAGADEDGDPARAGPKEEAIKDARKDLMDPDNADEGFEQGKNALSELEDDASDSAKQNQQDLLDDPAAQADDTLVDISNDINATANAAEAFEPGGSAGLGRISLASWMSQEVCAVGRQANAANTVAFIAKRVNMLRFAGLITGIVDAQLDGTTRPIKHGELMELLQTGPDGSNWMQSPGMINIMGSGGATASEGELAVFGTSPPALGGFLGAIIAFYTIPTVRQSCQFATSVPGQAALSAVEIGGSLLTGGGLTISVQALKGLLTQAVRSSAPYIAGSVGFYFLGRYVTSAVENAALTTMHSFSPNQGGKFSGDTMASSKGVLDEVKYRNAGMKPLTRQEYSSLMKDVREERRTELAQTSLFDRFLSFDYKSSNHSLALRALQTSPIAATNIGTMAQNLALAFTGGGMVQQAQQFASTALSGSTYAQAGSSIVNEHGYVTDIYGTPIMGHPSLDDVDPIENLGRFAGQALSNGEYTGEVKEYLDECGQESIYEEGRNTFKPKCISNESKPVQAFLADQTNDSGIDSVYTPVIDDPTHGENSGGGGVINPTEDTTHIPCPVGTENGGEPQDYGPGRSPGAKIRICGIPNAIPNDRGVNSSAAGKALAMIQAAARAGHTLKGNAFRSYEAQEALRQQNCADPVNTPSDQCDPPTAKPGTSMHEVGLAIDFSGLSSGAFNWLKANAASYGFYNLPSERWHWSVNGN